MRHLSRKVVLVVAAIALAVPLAAQAPSPQAGGVYSRPIPASIAEAEQEGANFPRGDTQIAPPRAFDTGGTIGTSDRRCVELTGTVAPLRGRSGEFVVGGEIGALRAGREGKVYWAPFHDPASVRATLFVRGSRLDQPESTSRFISSNYASPVAANGSVIGDHAFYASGFTLRSAGRWLLIATSANDWGCFIVTVS